MHPPPIITTSAVFFTQISPAHIKYIHRRGAEDAEITQRKLLSSLRRLCVLCASAVNFYYKLFFPADDYFACHVFAARLAVKAAMIGISAWLVERVLEGLAVGKHVRFEGTVVCFNSMPAAFVDPLDRRACRYGQNLRLELEAADLDCGFFSRAFCSRQRFSGLYSPLYNRCQHCQRHHVY